MSAPRLARGDLLPRLVTPVPGPRSRDLHRRLAAAEAPGVNTLAGGAEPIAWAEARGANVLDVDGNRYVDLTSGFGVAAVGHRHPRVVAAAERQARRLVHGLGDLHPHERRVELAEALLARAGVADGRVYFAVSGADAVEIALQTARLATRRRGVVAFSGAYHGSTLGALAVSARERFRAPFAAHLDPHVVRLAWGCPASRLREALADRRLAVGAVLLEPIQGREGVRPPPPGWLAEVAALAGRHGALLIADEVLTGCARTGPFFAAAAEGVAPDLLCCGKALGGGWPVAAVVGRDELMRAWPADGEALHTATFLAHPVACAAALAVLDLLSDPAAEAARTALAARLAAALAAWPERFAGQVVAVRGRGLLWGVELAAPGAAVRWAAAAARRGVLALPSGSHGEVLELLPPYTLSPRQLDAALAALGDSLAELA